jgi:glucosamine 6-phosphate synthetase-like amidotransferase/phosphosugar isomerase protein
MCTIYGIGFLKGHSLHDNHVPRMLLRKLIELNVDGNRSATGVAYCNSKKIRVVKKNVDGENFITLPEFVESSMDEVKMPLPRHPQLPDIEDTTNIILGHCRLKTKGPATNNLNNHPVVYGDVVGIHNGVISNDDELFSKYGIPRRAEVDSEAIFALINYYSRNVSIELAIQTAMEDIQGSLACAMVHRKYPNLLWLFRRNNPCTLYKYDKIGLLIWATRAVNAYDAVEYTEKVVPSFSAGEPDVIDYPAMSGVCIDVKRIKMRTFDIKPGRHHFGFA